MLVLLPVAPTQCAAVSTICVVYSAPPQPMDRRTMKGNSPWAARVPPTTCGVTSSGGGAATAWPVAVPRTAAAPTTTRAARRRLDLNLNTVVSFRQSDIGQQGVERVEPRR
jgi:hypothetical protein